MRPEGQPASAAASNSTRREEPRRFIPGKLPLLLFIIAALALLAPFFYAFAFCFPRGDDFDASTRAMFPGDMLGGIYEIGREWLFWSGRYAYHFLAVFLGRAAESRFLYGLICSLPLILFGYGGVRLAKALNGARLPRLLNIAVLLCCILALCSSFHTLPAFYLLTDALTTGLQPGFCLIFTGSLLELEKINAEKADARANWLPCAIAGVFLIGLYEHGALAVFWLMFFAAFIKWTHEKGEIRSSKKHWAAICHFHSMAYQPAFKKISLILACAFLFSFLAPGNWLRKTIRHVDAHQQWRQILQIPEEILEVLRTFGLSLWPWTAICIALLLALWTPFKERPAHLRQKICAISFSWAGFILSCALLHALGDAPLGSAPKFAASLGFYTALALCSVLYPGCSRLLAGCSDAGKRLASYVTFGALLTLTALSPNFQKTAANAVNGQMAALNNFMTIRDNWLEIQGQRKPETYGLIREFREPDIRSRKSKGTSQGLSVAAWLEPVFPVWLGMDLAKDFTIWPNPWAAWFYGISGIRATAPDPASAIAMSTNGEALELRMPAELRPYISGAWIAQSGVAGNPTFETTWLILKTEKPISGAIEVLAPARLAPERPLPEFFQRLLYKKLASDQISAYVQLVPFAFVLTRQPLNYAQPDLYRAIPIGQCEIAPASLWLRINKGPFLHLEPWLF